MLRTEHGVELAFKLDKSPAPTIIAICSELCKHAVALHRLAEIGCNRTMTRRETYNETACEGIIKDCVFSLQIHYPQITGVEFSGDPRGAVVKLVVNDRSGDCFGGDRWLIVPGS